MRRTNPFFITEIIDSGKRSSLGWVEDSYSPGLSDFSLAGVGQGFLGLPLANGKLRLFLAFIFLALALIAGRSLYLQSIKGEYYFSLAENNRIRINYSRAQRGIIYDRNGKPLVKNISGFSLLITPVGLPEDSQAQQAVLARVAGVAGIDQKEIEEKISDKRYFFQPIIIKTGIDYEQAMLLKVLSADLPGVTLEVDAWRSYIDGQSFSHLLGYVGKISPEEYEEKSAAYLLSDNIGKIGLEKYYEDYLRGHHGEKKVEVDALGQEKKILSYFSPLAGSDIVLAVDADLQNRIYEILEERLGQTKAASVIVSDPTNGEILALVDYPSYDNNLFSLGISQVDYQKLLDDERKPLFSRSIAGEYPSGSTIKLVLATAGLEEGVIDRQTSFNSVGGLWIGKWFFPDWRAGGHGSTNVVKAIADSVNTFFYYLGGGYGDFQGLGVERIVKYLDMFGLGNTTGIDLPNEKPGLVPTPEWKQALKDEIWYIGDTYHLAIGQGDLLVTPLQVNNYTVAIANGGKLYRPHLAREIIQADGVRQAVMPEVILDNFVQPENLQIVREGMRQTVTAGSARSLMALPVEVAGKTGTAQWNNNKENHAWFTGFAPYEQPTFVITILVEEGGEGSSIAVPIASEIIRYWFTKN